MPLLDAMPPRIEPMPAGLAPLEPSRPWQVCHGESDCPAAAMGVWATRMLCGKCARESAYSDRPCEHCGNSYARPAGPAPDPNHALCRIAASSM